MNIENKTVLLRPGPPPWASSMGWRTAKRIFFFDPVSRSIAESWRTGPDKALERQFAAFTPQSAENVTAENAA